MCWLPIDQPLLRPGDSTFSSRRPSPCSAAQLLASRLRRVGDQLEKSWTAGETDSGGSSSGGGGKETLALSGRLKSFLRAAIRCTALALAVARRHL